MRILFIARHFTYFRNFDSVIESLARRGHDIHLAADRDEALGGRALVDDLAARFPQVAVGFTPVHAFGRYTRVARALRLGLDYLRYSDPRFASMPKIRQRAYERTPAFVLALARLPFRRALAWALDRLEQAVPRQKGVDAFVAGARPDLLLVTPLIELGSPQLDYVRSARRLGVRSALCVWSWDHLSSKALIRVPPDAVIVWNETQKEEAARFHGIPPERVLVTGAQCFDRWFDRRPSRGRADFCRRAGLPGDGPFILYVCSALFRGSPSEAAFVREWVRAIRGSPDPALHGMNILVRPHPQRLDDWTARDAAGTAPLEGAVLWGSNPIDDERRAEYFDSLHHSAAVVGLNTSALVEAAIVDRPVYTLLLPEFHENQEGTFHFQHLMTVGDGFLNTSRTLSEHVAQLAALARGMASQAGTHSKPNRPFVERFIRPRGAGVAATPVFVETVERLASAPKLAPQSPPAWVFLLRPLVYALVLAGRLPLVERLYWNPAKIRIQASGLRTQKAQAS
ncbi:MAG: hypothetical protein ACRD26_23355 [Vicinamibacterales bacterium]